MSTETKTRHTNARQKLMVIATLVTPSSSPGHSHGQLRFNFDWNNRKEVRDFAARSDRCIRAGGWTKVELASHVRCETCGWPLASDRKDGCVLGDCSYRGNKVL